MEALDVEMSIAEGEQALQALLQFAREQAGKLEAHEAEKGIFKRLLPIGLAAMKLYFAQRGTGDVGPALTRADGVLLPREKQLRGRDYFSLFGKFAVARPCYRTPGEPGIYPLDAQVNLPERCYSYFLQEWMTLFEVEHPFRDSAGLFAQLFDLDVAESVILQFQATAPRSSTSSCSTTAAATPWPTRWGARRCAASAARPASTSARCTSAPAATPTARSTPARSARS